MKLKQRMLIAPLLVSLLFAACTTVGPNYVKPQLQVPEQWVNAKDGSAVKTSPEGLSQWWNTFNDETLSLLIKEALRDSLDIRNVQARLREARARRDLAVGNRLPTVSASGSASRYRTAVVNGNDATSNSFTAGLDASWEADVFGGLKRGVEAAEADLATTRADRQSVQVTLAAEVALNYINLRNYQTRLAIAKDNLAAQSETLQITQWREQAGLTTAVEVEQARTNVEQTRASIPALSTSLTEAENRLAILLGKPPASLHAMLAKTSNFPEISEQIAIGIPAETLRQRPDVRAAEQRLIAETARVGQQTTALYPDLSLSGSFGWKALTLGALGGSGTFFSSIVGNVTQTVFDAGRIRSRINIQSAVQEQALISYEKNVLTALEEVENSLSAYANNRERQTILGLATASSREAARLARLRFESGLIDFQAVLDTERTRLSTEDALANSQAEGLSSLISLYKALGGGWTELALNETDAKTQKAIDHE